MINLILAMIKHYELYTVIVNINTSNYLTKVAPTNNGGYFNAMANCIQDIDYVSIAYISSDSFGVTCKNKNDGKFYYSYISISGRSLNLVTSLSLSDSSSVSNLNLIGFQGKDIGFFFNNGTDAYFYLLFIPICFDIKLESLSDNNQVPLSVNLNDTIYISIHVKDSNFKVEILPKEIYSKENSIQFFINNENIINNHYYTQHFTQN